MAESNLREGKPVLIPGDYFPDDLDMTAIALTTLRPDAEVVTSLLEEMLTYLNPDGTFQVSLVVSDGIFNLFKMRPMRRKTLY